MSPIRVGVVCDYREEGWPSMDLMADMLLQHLHSDHAGEIDAQPIQPALRRRFGARLSQSDAPHSFLSRRRRNLDRAWGRYVDYPAVLRHQRKRHDVFHLVDHSYSHLVHELPRGRAVVTCHDLDTFRCVLDPGRDRRSWVQRAIARRVLNGFRMAARVVCVSEATRSEILGYGLVPADRLRVVPNGCDPVFTPVADGAGDSALQRILGTRAPGSIELLHVGSTIPRKRIDLLLEVVARLRQARPEVRLVRVGGAFTPEQSARVAELGLQERIFVLPFLERRVLAAAYRRADLVLQPSEREGFGLPVVEALASGTPVLASDLEVIREVAGDAASFAPVADADAWVGAGLELLRERDESPASWAARAERGVARAARYSWGEHARRVAALYRDLVDS